MNFDPKSARLLYAEKDTDELVRIAFLEETYLPEAKKLAEEELARRGLREVDSQTIDRVRAGMEELCSEELEEQMRGMEYEDEVSSWRQAIRERIAPYRLVLKAIVLVFVALWLISGFANDGLFGFEARYIQVIVVLVGVLVAYFLVPTREEFMRERKSKDHEEK